MTTTTATLPLTPGIWSLDPLHCSVEFTARHMAISKVRGRFHDVTAAAQYRVTGDLTVNGIAHAETLDVTFHGTEVFPGDGSLHAGFEATGSINRKDYGVDFNVPLGAGGFVIADKIGIELDVQLFAPGA